MFDIEKLKSEVVLNHDKFELTTNKLLDGVKLVANIMVPVISLIAAIVKMKK